MPREPDSEDVYGRLVEAACALARRLSGANQGCHLHIDGKSQEVRIILVGEPSSPERPIPVGKQRTIEEDILQALRKAGHRMVWTELLAALGPDNPWGESTVRHALCAMNQAGTLNNRQDVRPRGYGLCSWE